MSKKPIKAKNAFPKTITIVKDNDDWHGFMVVPAKCPAPEPEHPRTQAVYKLVEVQQVVSQLSVTTKTLKK